MNTPTKRLLCAVYTRKSSEEGLEQDYNSLDAQRDACEAYVRSQQALGWNLSPTRYDDGGFSGGTLQRPALTELLADIQNRKINVVVVYKVDRLTRSLSDFTKLVDLFDANGVSFVSVTQQFNTTTSMGRLTLNVLLSFAQFEREVTAERIRDKIAASKRKGMWMGGIPPMGYIPAERTLKIDWDEADRVKVIFSLYLDCGCVRKLKDELDRRNWKTRVRKGEKGESGYKPFSRGHLYRILGNPIYIGKIAHKGQVYDGQHPAIIDAVLWAAVQQQLKDQGSGKKRTDARMPRLLTGLLFDAQGGRLTPTYSKKRTRLYQYYVSNSKHQGRESENAQFRLPANELEAAVIGKLCSWLRDAAQMADIVKVYGGDVQHGIHAAADLAERISGDGATVSVALCSIVEKIVVEREIVTIFARPAPAIGLHQGDGEQLHELQVKIRIDRVGSAVRLVVAGPRAIAKTDRKLLDLLRKAHDWFELLTSGKCDSIAAIAEQEGVSGSYVTRILYLAFIAPEIVQLVVEGNQPLGMTAERMAHFGALPARWSEQMTMRSD